MTADQAPVTIQPSSGSSGGLQFPLKPFPLGLVQTMRLFDGFEQSSGGRGVVPVALQFRDHLTLPRDVAAVSRNMPFDLSKMPLRRCSVHLDFLLRTSPP